MRNLKSVGELQAKFRATFRARAKAAKAGTMRTKVLKRIDELERLYAETAWVQRYYCTQFRFWRLCRFAPWRRARACKGDADACLKRSVDQVPRHEIWQTRQKLLEATPRHFGVVERKVRQTWPSDFWPRPVDRELLRALAEARRQRQLPRVVRRDATMRPRGCQIAPNPDPQKGSVLDAKIPLRGSLLSAILHAGQ